MPSVTVQHFQEIGGGGGGAGGGGSSNRVIMDLGHALQWGHTRAYDVRPTHRVVILIMQSQVNRSMVAAATLSNCAK